jgi:hypothetical protein
MIVSKWAVSIEWFITRALAVVIAIAVIYGFGAFSAYRASLPHVREAEEFRQKAVDAVTFADSLSQVTEDRQKEIDGLKRQVSNLRSQRPNQRELNAQKAVVDSVYASLEEGLITSLFIIPMQRDLIQAQDSTITVQNQVITEQERIIFLQDMTIVDLSLSRDSLRGVLVSVPPPVGQERFLGLLPMPSRKTSFIVGAVGGAVLVTSLLK